MGFYYVIMEDVLMVRMRIKELLADRCKLQDINVHFLSNNNVQFLSSC